VLLLFHVKLLVNLLLGRGLIVFQLLWPGGFFSLLKFNPVGFAFPFFLSSSTRVVPKSRTQGSCYSSNEPF